MRSEPLGRRRLHLGAAVSKGKRKARGGVKWDVGGEGEGGVTRELTGGQAISQPYIDMIVADHRHDAHLQDRPHARNRKSAIRLRL